MLDDLLLRRKGFRLRDAGRQLLPGEFSRHLDFYSPKKGRQGSNDSMTACSPAWDASQSSRVSRKCTISAESLSRGCRDSPFGRYPTARLTASEA